MRGRRGGLRGFDGEIRRDEAASHTSRADDAGIIAEAVFNRAVLGVMHKHASTFEGRFR